MLLIFSEASNKSVQVQREVERAVHKDVPLRSGAHRERDADADDGVLHQFAALVRRDPDAARAAPRTLGAGGQGTPDEARRRQRAAAGEHAVARCPAGAGGRGAPAPVSAPPVAAPPPASTAAPAAAPSVPADSGRTADRRQLRTDAGPRQRAVRQRRVCRSAPAAREPGGRARLPADGEGQQGGRPRAVSARGARAAGGASEHHSRPRFRRAGRHDVRGHRSAGGRQPGRNWSAPRALAARKAESRSFAN